MSARSLYQSNRANREPAIECVRGERVDMREVRPYHGPPIASRDESRVAHQVDHPPPADVSSERGVRIHPQTHVRRLAV